MDFNITEATLTPAYGRDYGSKAACIEDFRKGRDFIVNHPLARFRYCSIRDFKEGDMAKFRYNRLKNACFYMVVGADVNRAE